MRAPVFRGNIIVSNLPSQLTSPELAEMFDRYGLVLGAKIERWHDRPGGAQGMVDLAPATSVDKAIAELNGQVLAGNKLVVRKAPPKKKAATPAASRPRAETPPEPLVSAPKRVPLPASMRDEAAPFGSPSMPPRPATTRKVVVEYRTPTRRIVIPPRARSADHGVG